MTAVLCALRATTKLAKASGMRLATTAGYKLGEFAFLRGWFTVGAAEGATTSPLGVRYLGEDTPQNRVKIHRFQNPAQRNASHAPRSALHFAQIVKTGESDGRIFHLIVGNRGGRDRAAYHGARG